MVSLGDMSSFSPSGFLAAFCFGIFLTSSAVGMYMGPDLKKVPIATLLTNLEKKAANSDSAEDFHHLARAHAMAYAWKLSEKDEVEVSNPSEQLWFGFEPAFVPFARGEKPAGEKVVPEAVQDHLAKAIENYEKALKLTPEDPTIQLGYGWCLEQSGKKGKAIKVYRTALETFWKEDRERSGILGPVATVETAGYLIPLLDATKDSAEIADLKAKVEKIEALPRAITPIAVALKPQTTLPEIMAPDAAVRFDADGSGRNDPWSWITPQAAWLVYDQRGNGEITSAIQMFGNRTFLLFLRDGYAAMELLDADGDAMLRGKELDHLALWQDHNVDGVSDAGEVRSLASHEIVSFAIRPILHESGILTCPDGVRFKDGSSAPTFDVILSRKDVESGH